MVRAQLHQRGITSWLTVHGPLSPVGSQSIVARSFLTMRTLLVDLGLMRWGRLVDLQIEGSRSRHVIRPSCMRNTTSPTVSGAQRKVINHTMDSTRPGTELLQALRGPFRVTKRMVRILVSRLTKGCLQSIERMLQSRVLPPVGPVPLSIPW